MKVLIVYATFLLGILLYGILRPTDSTDVSRWNRSGMKLYTDNKTGLQYLSSGFCGGLTPRLDENGKQVREWLPK